MIYFILKTIYEGSVVKGQHLFFQQMSCFYCYIEYKNKTQEKCNYCTIYQCISGFYKKNVELHLLLILAIDSVIYSFYVTILLCKKAPVFD